MGDFFGDKPAEVRAHVDVSKLLWEAKAELNALEKQEEKDFDAYREIGRKLEEVIASVGHGGMKLASSKLKIGERQVRNIVALFHAGPHIDREEARAILWGYGATAKNGTGGGQKVESVVAYSHSKLWGGANRFETQAKAFARENGLLEDPDYKALAGAIQTAKSTFRALEKRAKA